MMLVEIMDSSSATNSKSESFIIFLKSPSHPFQLNQAMQKYHY